MRFFFSFFQNLKNRNIPRILKNKEKQKKGKTKKNTQKRKERTAHTHTEREQTELRYEFTAAAATTDNPHRIKRYECFRRFNRRRKNPKERRRIGQRDNQPRNPRGLPNQTWKDTRENTQPCKETILIIYHFIQYLLLLFFNLRG